VIQQQTAALRPTNTVDTPIQTREVENVRQPRGIRNNNPFNLPAGVRYAGLASPINMTPSQAAEARYAVFQTPEHGISAGIAKIRQDVAKAGKSDVETVARLFSSPDRADQYAKYLGRKLEVLPIETIDLDDYLTMMRLVVSVIKFENGEQPYSNATIRRGLTLAGYELTNTGSN
jgi:hypothetical protein